MKQWIMILAALTAQYTYAMGAPQGQGQQGSPYGMLFMVGGLLIVMYFFMMRPEQRRRREKEEMLKRVAPGDKIITTGGIYGTVRQVKEQTVRLQIDDQCRIEIAKASVADILEKTGESESK
jgi:preprotein translocase subunit YajC